MKENLLFSVIIPSYNRADEIDELLSSLTQLKSPTPDYEVIIVDDGSSDNTAEVVSKYQDQGDVTLRFIRQENQGPGAARNNGMQHADGDFFIFLDSDTLVDQGWLNAIHAAVGEGTDAFGGPDGASEDFTDLQKAINYSMTSSLTTGGIRGKKKRIGKYYPRSFNMGLSREVYDNIGGFGALRHGQDIEFSQRIIDSGANVRFVPDAVVYHKRRSSLKKFFKQVFNWGVARINLYKINSDMLEPVHALPAIALVLAIIVLVLALLGTFWAEILVGSGIVILFLVAIHAWTVIRSIKSAFLVMIVIPTQVLGYGSGFLWGAFQRVFLRKEEIVGFQKKYYQ